MRFVPLFNRWLLMLRDCAGHLRSTADRKAPPTVPLRSQADIIETMAIDSDRDEIDVIASIVGTLVN